EPAGTPCAGSEVPPAGSQSHRAAPRTSRVARRREPRTGRYGRRRAVRVGEVDLVQHEAEPTTTVRGDTREEHGPGDRQDRAAVPGAAAVLRPARPQPAVPGRARR